MEHSSLRASRAPRTLEVRSAVQQAAWNLWPHSRPALDPGLMSSQHIPQTLAASMLFAMLPGSTQLEVFIVFSSSGGIKESLGVPLEGVEEEAEGRGRQVGEDGGELGEVGLHEGGHLLLGEGGDQGRRHGSTGAWCNTPWWPDSQTQPQTTCRHTGSHLTPVRTRPLSYTKYMKQ